VTVARRHGIRSTWGHGSYVAPDWTADWLHREAMCILDRWAGDEVNADYEELTAERHAQLTGWLTEMLRTNTYDVSLKTVTIDPLRAEELDAFVSHHSEIFAEGNSDYAIPPGAVSDQARLRMLCAFIFWTA
jgi:nitric oxide reductase subunit B